MPPKLSIIYPTYNEMGLNYLETNINIFAKVPSLEVIFVDSKSNDGTLERLNQTPHLIISTTKRLRSEKMNLGFEHAAGDIILFHHPRSQITIEGLNFLIYSNDKFLWGGFKHQFDIQHPILRFTSWYSNSIRPKVHGIVYLDHCIFASRELLRQVNKPLWPEVEIFEDSDFSLKLACFSNPSILPYAAVTSAIRFRRNGLLWQIVMNQVLKWAYYLGFDRKKMNQWYERHLFLNQKQHKGNDN